VEWTHHDAGTEGPELLLRGADLPGPGQEAEDVAPARGQGVPHALRGRPPRRVLDLNGVRPALDLHHRRTAEEVGDRPGLERRRHDEDPQVRPRPPNLGEEGEAEVGVQGPLVKLVENDGPKVREERIGVEPGGEDALRGHEEVRLLRVLALEAHLPAHLAADLPRALLGDPAGDRAGGDPPRLEQEHRPVADEGGRNARRLPRPRLRDEHRGPPGPERLDDTRHRVVDGQGREHQRPWYPTPAGAPARPRNPGPGPCVGTVERGRGRWRSFCSG
jgi:hypothetical protein